MLTHIAFGMERLAMDVAPKDPQTVARIRKGTTEALSEIASFIRRHNGDHDAEVAAGKRDENGVFLDPD